MDHIAVLNDVFFTFCPHFARFFGFGFAAEGNEIVVGNHLGADEAAFEIGVDDTGRLRGGIAFLNCPRAHFFDAGSEVGLQAEGCSRRGLSD